MELSNTKKLTQHIFRLLKVSEIVIPIGRTPKGNLGLKFSANQEDFEMLLDSVPLSIKDSLNDENNIELKRMLEKYLFDQPQLYYDAASKSVKEVTRQFLANEVVKDVLKQPKKKRGRPAKVK